MAKSFTGVAQDSPRTGLRIPVKTNKPFGFKLHGWLVPA